MQLPSIFIHAIDPDDTMAVHSLGLIKSLTSAEYGPRAPDGRSIRDIPLDELARVTSLGTMSPRAAWYVWAAAIIRGGGHVGIGVEPYPTRWATKDAEEKFVRIGDMELEFEKVRRALAPNAPSRLSCLWIAEDSPAARSGVEKMFGGRRKILKVRVPHAQRLVNADHAWIDEYMNTSDLSAIENYWKSVPHPAHEFWEFLLDGRIELDPSEDTPELADFTGARIAAFNAENERNKMPPKS